MLALLDAITRETIVFASVGLLVGGIDDLLVDLIFVVRLLLYRGDGTRTLADLPPGGGGTIVVFVPAWDESRVIGGMLRAALARFDHADYRIYVGLYPNDRATIDAAATVAERDDRVTLVIGPRDGPTTKADCLNALWRALARDEAAGVGGQGCGKWDCAGYVGTWWDVCGGNRWITPVQTTIGRGGSAFPVPVDAVRRCDGRSGAVRG